MKTVYIESSVIGYLTARLSRDIVVSARQAITTEWWENCRDSFEIFISELVIEEVGSGDYIAAQKRLLQSLKSFLYLRPQKTRNNLLKS